MSGVWGQSSTISLTMRRRLFSIVTVMSLVLCVASVAMWVRSLSYSEMVAYNGDSVEIGAVYLDGWVVVLDGFSFDKGWFFESKLVEARADIDQSFDYYQRGCEYELSFAGVHIFRNGPYSKWVVFIPLWLTTLLTLPAPILWLIFFRKNSRRYRLAHGLCVGCGYDMRASEGACPECGHSTA